MAYTIIDNDIIKIGSKLKANEFRVLMVLLAYQNKEKGYAYPSHKDLMKDCAIKDKGTLIKVINDLDEKGYIKKETVKGKGNKYFICGEVGKNPTGMEKPHQEVWKNPTTSSMEKPYTINTNTITNKNTKYIDAFTQIFKFWNDKKIVVHKKHNDLMVGAYKKALKNFSDEEIREAIENYSKVLESNFYYSHKFSLDKFLSQKNGISNFTNEGHIYLNYLEKEKTPFGEGAKEFKKLNYNNSICKTSTKNTQLVKVHNNF